ncbi:MAG: alanine racemase [Bdellovibrionota bacterium]
MCAICEYFNTDIKASVDKMECDYKKILADIEKKDIKLGQEIEEYKYRLSFIDVNLANIARNYLFVKQKVGNRKIMAITKANAYGHGLFIHFAFFASIRGRFFWNCIFRRGDSVKT